MENVLDYFCIFMVIGIISNGNKPSIALRQYLQYLAKCHTFCYISKVNPLKVMIIEGEFNNVYSSKQLWVTIPFLNATDPPWLGGSYDQLGCTRPMHQCISLPKYHSKPINEGYLYSSAYFVCTSHLGITLEIMPLRNTC